MSGGSRVGYAQGSFSGRGRPTGLFHCLVGLGVYGLLVVSGAVALIDDLLYDGTARWLPPREIRDSHVFLVSTVSPSGSTIDWSALLSRIREAEPAAIAFTHFPDAGESFYREAGDVFFGRALIDLGDRAPMLADLPEAARKWVDEERIGSVLVGRPSGRHHSHALGEHPFEGRQRPSLTALLARRTGIEPPSGRFRVDFRWGAGMLPNAHVSRLMASEIPGEMMRDRVVLIGPPLEPVSAARAGLAIPGGRTIGSEAFEGFVLETLLSDRATRELPPPLLWISVLVASLSIAAVYQFLYIKPAVRLTLWAIALASLATWLCLAFGSIWLPLADLLVVIAVVTAVAVFDRYLMLIERVRVFSLDFRTTEVVPEDRPLTKEHWLPSLLTAHVDAKTVQQLYAIQEHSRRSSVDEALEDAEPRKQPPEAVQRFRRLAGRGAH